jgi:hypothetical protein
MLCALVVGLAMTAGAQGVHNNGLKLLEEYFDLLISGNLQSAEQLWKPSVLERSRRFDITYQGPVFKVDCNSPIVRDFEAYRDYLNPAATQALVLRRDSLFRLEYRKRGDTVSARHSYYIELYNGYLWLSARHEFFSRTWPTVTSKYFRIHCNPKRLAHLNQAALDAADLFVQAMCDSLDLPDEVHRALSERKIEYYLAENDAEVQTMTGNLVKGLLDLPTSDVISAAFPHFHEIVHLLINMKLREIPLFSHPLVQEGLAVRYGGRWGRSSAALTDLGVFLFREQIVPLDSLLTLEGFNAIAGADVAYPVAGLVTAYLLDQSGLDRYLDLYRDLSGTSLDLTLLGAGEVKKLLYEAAGKKDWASFRESFGEFLDRNIMKQAASKPGSARGCKPLLNGDRYEVATNDDWLSFSFDIDTAKASTGTLFWSVDSALAVGSSALFEEHFGDKRPFDGFRYSVRYDRNEAGLYDYATNQLLAKYIWGITPSEDYIDDDAGRVRISFRRSMVGGVLPDEGDVWFEPQR